VDDLVELLIVVGLILAIMLLSFSKKICVG